MKTIKYLFSQIIAIVFLFMLSLNAYALDYTISFTGSKASSTVGSIEVHNLTSDKSVIVPAGNVLKLSDAPNAVNSVYANGEFVNIYPNPILGKSILSFYSNRTGNAQINIIAPDGRRIIGTANQLEEGDNSFQLSLPTGAYIIKITGVGFSYTARVISQSHHVYVPEITFIGNSKRDLSSLQKSKGETATTLYYTEGDRLLYKGISGNYSTIITDVPTSSKTVNFEFVECKDGFGNYYSTVKIGTQVWMVENLNTTKYLTGDAIVEVKDDAAWMSLTTGAYCDNNNSPTNGLMYGKLYNWFAVNDARKIAPTGWHVPTNIEWISLSDYLGGASVAGGKLKETGTSHWNSLNNLATNETGFSAFGGGFRTNSGVFLDPGLQGGWWSATPADTSYSFSRRMLNSLGSLIQDNNKLNQYGYSVRCVRDISSLPVLKTTDLTGITQTTAIGGGNITSDGNEPIIARGICWSTSPNPTINDFKTNDGTGKGVFTSSLTGLTILTTYYVRAYATNSIGTAYGNEISFTTLATLPTLTTTAPTDITTTAATSGGNITSDGGATVTVRGVCWSTTASPTIDNFKTSDGNGTGNFTSLLNGLNPNTKYYIRAYASNSAGTSYGNEISFTTQVALPTLTTVALTAITNATASSGGNITDDGGATITARGICWSTISSPTILDNKTTNGTGTGTFISSLTGLSNATTYYLRAYATNSAGTSYGNEISFTTLAALPTLTTTSSSSITATTATSGGNITNDGGATVTARGICWSSTTNPTINDSKTSEGSGIGDFTSSITGLSPNTKYYIRSYATNSVGTSYGNEISFTTLPALSTISTTAVSSITANTAVCGGNITSDGNATITTRGVCWSTTTNPTVNDSKTSDGTGTGAFTSSLTGLSPNIKYYVRSYAINNAGTSYGNEISFTTLTALPSVTTTAVSNLTGISAITGGSISSDGGALITARGVCWSTTANPTISNNRTTDSLGIGSFVSHITGLAILTKYYVRAYATNSVGTSYGTQISFTTTATYSTLTTNAVADITQFTATCGGSITADGGSSVTARGVCWDINNDPTIDLSTKTVDGSGRGTFASSITGLDLGTTYYVRAYATNSIGTSYGNEVTFTTTGPIPPTLSTAVITSVGVSTATSGGNITYDGGAVIIQSGVCWSTSPNPTLTNSFTTEGSGTGVYSSLMTGLAANTTYYVRAYATNNAGTSYGNELNFKTYTGTVTDIDGNVYKTITIGTQVWMVENLKTTKYRNSEPIPNVTDNSIWYYQGSGAQCTYNNDPINGNKYGRLYNGYAVTDTRNIAPKGWHIPTDIEWTILENYLITNGYNYDGSFIGNLIGKSLASKTDWPFDSTIGNIGYNLETNNLSGFSFTPSGCRYQIYWSQISDFSAFPDFGYEWTSTMEGTNLYYRTLSSHYNYLERSYGTKSAGFPVRCIKGEALSLPTITTPAISTITTNSAISGGNITSDGNATITARGICWSTSSNPTITNSFTTDGTGMGSFTSSMSGLTPNTTYYVRAYAINSVGTAYGNEVSFTTLTALPTITTAAISEITAVSAITGGNIISDGGASVTARGMCWSTTSNPTIANSTILVGSGTGSFSSTVLGLTPKTTYYISAFATNSTGTAYGEEFTFTTSTLNLPSISTASISSLLTKSALSGGNITSDGGAPILSRGVCWNISPNPTISDNIIQDSTGNYIFTSFISGLKPITTYYVRAYATNILGTAYGNETSFKTGDDTFITFDVGNNLVGTLSNAVYTESGMKATFTNIEANWIGDPLNYGKDGNKLYFHGSEATVTFSLEDGTKFQLQGFDLQTNFNTRILKTSSGINRELTSGEYCFSGNEYNNLDWFSITTPQWATQIDNICFKRNNNSIPTVITSAIINISGIAATTGGYVTSDGGATITDRGVCWSTSPNPTITNNKTSDGSGKGLSSTLLTGLIPLTKYYIRAYATNSVGTSYGAQLSFTTTATYSTLTTNAVVDITQFTATSGGSVSSDGGSSVTARGVCWDINNDPTIDLSTKTVDGSGRGTFLSSITGLDLGTTYYVRAYSTNSIGTSYGNEVTFTTTGPILPTLVTSVITGIGINKATGGGNITYDGGTAITQSGVCWSTSPSPTLSNNYTAEGSGTGLFSSLMTGLTGNTTYYVRAYATNNVGTSYGNELTFTTPGTITDIDGNVYHSILIGSQLWLLENLKTTKYRNGDVITLVKDNTVWSALTTGAYCEYNNDPSVGITYGKLYNGYAVKDSRNIAPLGWHVPTTAEWATLMNYLGGDYYSIYNKLKDTGTTHWSYDFGSTNESGFTALPGGYRINYGEFRDLGQAANWWSSSESNTNELIERYIYNYYWQSGSVFNSNKLSGLSVRCIRGEIVTLNTKSASTITTTNAISGGIITNDAGSAITERGVCWSTSPNPTIDNSSTTDGTGIGEFKSYITGLIANTTYYVRAYATNNQGITYGDELVFKTAIQIVVPTLTTTIPTIITTTNATCGGNISSDGGAAVTASGVCWSTSPNPTTSNNRTIEGAGIGTFSSLILGLTANTTYYVRAYATNSIGTTYGEEFSFKTAISATLATITTSDVSEITGITAKSGGVVISDGGELVTSRGVCWSTTANPTISNTRTTDSLGIGSFVSSVTGLLPKTKYYVRAFATNSVGTSYGNQINFTTTATYSTLTTNAVTDITQFSATCGGSVTADGASTVTERGVCWDTNSNPTVSLSTKTVDGNGRGAFVSSITGLELGTTYYVRAYSTNEIGTAYGNEVTFTTTGPITPTVTTSTVSNIDVNTVTSGGNVTYNGGSVVIQCGVCWSTLPNPNLNNSFTNEGSGSGAFTSLITGLLPGTIYYVKAYAINNIGTSYGEEKTFKTLSTLPTLSTIEITTITSTTAISGGIITSNGGDSIIAKGVCWSTEQNPSYYYYKTNDGTGLANFSSYISGLTPNTTYYVRAYATNSVGIAYGQMSTFSTLTTVTTNPLKLITMNSASAGGNVTVGGGVTVTARGVCWSTTINPTIDLQTKTSNYTGTGTFTSAITGLQPNTKYYVRAYAVNSAGTSYGDNIIFTTPGTVNDVDGNVYNSVTIGTQTWLIENLKTTKYRDGSSIRNISNATQWSSLTTGAYCSYDNDSSNVKTYGQLYNYYAVSDNRNIAPADWHVSTNSEWSTLQAYLISNGFNFDTSISDNNIAKSLASTNGWSLSSVIGSIGNDLTQNNKTTFNALAGGFRQPDGTFNGFGDLSEWWCSDNYNFYNFYYYGLGYDNIGLIFQGLNSTNNSPKSGFAVRCVKDISSTVTSPTVTTNPLKLITMNSASCGGNVTVGGGVTVTARGVCWSTTINPTIDLQTKTSNYTGTGTFTSAITGLQPNTKYYVRAYAVNSAGTSYGDNIIFTTPGTVTDVDGNVYNSVTIGTQTWLIENLKTTKYRDGSSIRNISNATQWSSLTTGAYCSYDNDSSNVKTYGQLYNYYAVSDNRNIAPADWHVSTNSEWSTLQAYLISNGFNFDTSISDNNIAKSLASTNGWSLSSVIGSIGNDLTQNNKTTFNALAGGFRQPDGTFNGFGDLSEWWCSDNPNYYNYYYYYGLSYDNKGLIFQGLNSTNNSPKYGFSVRCVKGLVLALPSLSTSDITNITTTSATCGGIILSDGDAMVTARGICWNTSSNPTIDNSFTTNGTGTGTFTSSINGLSPNTTYYVRTYATNSMGTSYGNEVSFTTAARTTAPILSTSTISNITSTSATSGGDITNDGGAPVTARGICWSLTANPTIANSFTVDSIGTATYISSMTGLTPNTTYYVRAYATNSVGTSYGNEVIFTTLSALPTLTTSAALAITSSTSTIEGNITSDGGAAITARGICWSTNSNPTIADSYTNDGTGTGTFSSSMTGLTPNTTYYVRAYATNSVGTSYGNEVSFTTFAALSTLTTSEASAITSSTSMIEGNITSDGGAAITARGICWSTSSKPTIADSYTNDGTGIGTFSSSMTGLTPNTTYYIRAYATNSVGTSYGNEVSLKTIQSGITYNVTVPIGTNEVYISGNFSISPWTTKNFKLSKVDVTHFTITIPDSLTTLNTEYKYCSGPDWYYEELNGIGSPINNRVYSSSDVVLEWRNVYNPSSAIEKDVTILATVPINTSECYITGGFDDWRGPITSNKMIKVSTTADGTIFTKTIHTIDSISLEYRFVAGPSWDYDQTQSENYKYRIDGAAVKVKSFKAYYNAISFTLPTLTTTIPSAITTTTATVGGEITNDGGTTVTARGVCWSTSSNPTIADSYTTDGTGTGVFTSLLTGLTPNVTYYVRAYATNIAGTAYGNEVTVACNTGNSSISGKIFNDINNNGLFDAGVDSVQSTGWVVKIQGPVNRTIVPSFDGTYSFNDLPLGIYTVSEIVPELWTVIAPFWGGEYTIDLTAGGNVVNKDFANIYLLRSNSDIEYLSFPNGQKTGDNSANPSSSLVPLSSVNISQVPVNSIHLYVNSAGYSPDTFYVTKNQIVQFAITNLDNSASHPTYFNDSRLLGVIVGLPPGETRMTTFKINNIQYGEKIHFLDGVPGHNQSGLMIVRDGTVHLPTTTTINPTKLTATTATSSGNITNDGGDYINSRGVCWSTTVNPTIADNKTSDGTGSGVFTSTITGLSPNTTYYVRAYATNVAGTSYGNEISFTTIIPIATPILTTNIALCTSSSTATCGGSISNDGGGAVSARGVCWSTSSNPTISLNHSSDSTGTGNFTSSLTGLTPNVTYYVRAYATNIAGTAYGNEVTVACNTGNSSISGKIFNDINNNGLFDAGVDSVQSTGWAVKIQGSVNRTIVPSFDGTYSFNDLPLGIYTVSEIVPEDWTVLSPYWSGKYTVDLSVGGNMVNKDFANFYLQRNNSDVESLFFPNRLNTGDNAVVPADPSSPKESAPISVANIPVNSIHLTVSTAGFKPDTLYIKKDYIVQFALTSTDDFTHIFYLDNPKFQGTILGVAGGETRMKCFKTYNVLPGEIYRFTCGIPGHSGRGEIGYMKIIGDPIIVVTPTVTTIPPSTITQTTIISGGNISSDGGTTVTARGICWNMMPNPTIANSKTADGFGTGSFTSSLTGLTAGTTYYIRAYATNSGGTSYGNEISFSTVSLSPKPGLIAYYPFNGNSIDESGNGHDGTVNGATLTTDRFGNVNKAYSFNGSNNWINLGTWFNYNKFSISLWVNKTGFSGDYECIIDNNHYWNPPSSHQNWLLQGNPSSLEYGFGVPDFPAPGINFNLKLNKWQHIICIKDSSTIKLYLDGILQNSVACNYAINYVDQNLCIGRHGGQFLRCFMGELDDIRFYNYPISDSEISQLYNESNNTTPVLPTLTTTTASAITSATSTSGGNIISDGGTTVSARGVCWSTAPTPTTANSYTTDGTGVGIFTSSMTGLTANTTYYVRAYATNSVGTAYGNEISFMTLLPATGTVTDIEGNVYDYLTIGSQTWMVENLKTTTYNDGTSIPNVTVASIWATLATPAYSWYNNDVANKNTYGGLYNWYAINTGKLAPTGWHVSTDAEWTTLTTYLGGESVAGGKLTEIGTAHWLIPNTGATNETGFTALPGGTHYSIDGTYLYLGNIGYWWTASESDAESAWNRGWSVSNNSFGVGRGVNYKRAGFSVRCIRDY